MASVCYLNLHPLLYISKPAARRGRLSVPCSDTSAGTEHTRLRQISVRRGGKKKKPEPVWHRVPMGRDKCWAPDGWESVITILWCKKRRKWLAGWNPTLATCLLWPLGRRGSSSFDVTFCTDAFQQYLNNIFQGRRV